jgi:aminotransferase
MLAKRVEIVKPSFVEESLRVIEQSPDIISLGAGEPDFPAPPNVIEFVKRNLSGKYTHYSPFQGILELREALAKKLKKENKIEASPDEIIVTCGSKEALLLAFLTLTDPGDEVIIPDPGYLAFRPMIEVIGAKAVSLPLLEEENFQIDIERLKRLITKKTKAIVINTPSNPLGCVLKRKVLEEIADLLVEKKIFALVDEAYEKLVYDNAKHISLASLNGMKDYVITTQSFSKSYAMCGFRVGYAVAKKEIIKEMREFKLCTTISAPTISQLAAIEALRGSKKYVEKMRREYDRRRKMLVKRLNEIPGIHCLKPEGAFYAFPNIKELKMSSFKLAKYFLEKAKVVVIPGTEFGKYGEGYLRLSYATSYEKIEEALERIEKLINKNFRNL